MADKEENSLGGRVRRYAKVGRAMSGVAARMAGSRYLGMKFDRAGNAAELKAALGGLKGPLMKVAQIMATIPDALPREYVQELQQLADLFGFARARGRRRGLARGGGLGGGGPGGRRGGRRRGEQRAHQQEGRHGPGLGTGRAGVKPRRGWGRVAAPHPVQRGPAQRPAPYFTMA